MSVLFFPSRLFHAVLIATIPLMACFPMRRLALRRAIVNCQTLHAFFKLLLPRLTAARTLHGNQRLDLIEQALRLRIPGLHSLPRPQQRLRYGAEPGHVTWPVLDRGDVQQGARVIRHRLVVAAVRSLLIPKQSLVQVQLDTRAMLVAKRKITLRMVIALLARRAVQPKRLGRPPPTLVAVKPCAGSA